MATEIKEHFIIFICVSLIISVQPDFVIFISISVASDQYKAFAVPTFKSPLKSIAYNKCELIPPVCVMALLPLFAIWYPHVG